MYKRVASLRVGFTVSGTAGHAVAVINLPTVINYGHTLLRILPPLTVMAPNAVESVVIALAVCAAVVAYHRITTAARPPLPPSPKGLPILGSLLDLNVPAPWELFASWSETVGMLPLYAEPF